MEKTGKNQLGRTFLKKNRLLNWGTKISEKTEEEGRGKGKMSSGNNGYMGDGECERKKEKVACASMDL